MAHWIERVALGALFIGAGINHFAQPRMYQAIMPDYLPNHRELVEISGVAEIALGGLALIPSASPVARWGLIALLIAVFPANVQMAVDSERYPQIPRWLLWARLPLQGVLIAWVWRALAPLKHR